MAQEASAQLESTSSMKSGVPKERQVGETPGDADVGRRCTSAPKEGHQCRRKQKVIFKLAWAPTGGPCSKVEGHQMTSGRRSFGTATRSAFVPRPLRSNSIGTTTP